MICCEGNAGFYEVGIIGAPMKMGYSVLGWNHPGFGESTVCLNYNFVSLTMTSKLIYFLTLIYLVSSLDERYVSVYQVKSTTFSSIDTFINFNKFNI